MHFILNIIIILLVILLMGSIFICFLKPGFFLTFCSEEAYIIENDISVSLVSSSYFINNVRGLKIFKINLGDRVLLNNYSDENIYKVVIDLNSDSIQDALKKQND